MGASQASIFGPVTSASSTAHSTGDQAPIYDVNVSTASGSSELINLSRKRARLSPVTVSAVTEIANEHQPEPDAVAALLALGGRRA